jgi:hypothetical protein
MIATNPHLFVISAGPGAGKTTVLPEPAKRGLQRAPRSRLTRASPTPSTPSGSTSPSSLPLRHSKPPPIKTHDPDRESCDPGS